MKALYLCHAPLVVNTEELKSKNPDRFTIVGARIFTSEVVSALIRYSNYDLFLLPECREQDQGGFRDTTLYAENRARFAFITEQELSSLGHYDTAVISQLYPDIYIGARLRQLSGCSNVPVTGVIHALDSPSNLQMIAMILGSSLQPYDALICSSQAGRNAMLNYLNLVEERIATTGARGFEARFAMPIIPPGLDTQDFAKNGSPDIRSSLAIDSGAVILCFGRLSPTTKADLVPLMIVFSKILSSGHDAWLILAGDDTHYKLADQLRATAERLGCGARVRVFPNPSACEKRNLYRCADVFVAPSDNLQETFGLALAEAMAARLPVVASDWSGHRDIVVENETGYLVPTKMPMLPTEGDGTEAADQLAATTILDNSSLYSALQSLISSKEKRLKFGLAGQERARSLYDWRVVIKAYGELWDGLSKKAKSCTASSLAPKLDLGQYDYRKIFGHYATSWFDSETPVELTELGWACMEAPDRIPVYLGTSPSFTAAEVHAILNDVAEIRGASVSEMVSRSQRNDDTNWRVKMRSVSRMLKYGLLQIIDAKSKTCGEVQIKPSKGIKPGAASSLG